MDCSPPDSSVHGDSLGKNTGVGCHALLQGVFPTQESNQGLQDHVDSLSAELPGKPLKKPVGSHIFSLASWSQDFEERVSGKKTTDKAEGRLLYGEQED